MMMAVAVAIAIGPAFPAPASDAAPVYMVATVSFDMDAGDAVGARRSGSLCLPAGGLAWREARPEALDAREAVTQAAREAGLAVDAADNPFEEGVSGVDRAIRVRVRALRLTACVPPGGLGRLMNRSRMVKGGGLMAIEWRIYARGRDDAAVTALTCTAFTYRGDPGTLPAMTLAGMRSAAIRVAAELQHGTGDISIEDEPCRRLRLSGGSSR